jgi:hypothetical protein
MSRIAQPPQRRKDTPALRQKEPMPSSLKASWEVVAGVIPGRPMPQFSREWCYTSQQKEEDERQGIDPAYHSIFAKMRADVLDYYMQISNPNLNNWAEITFLWY